MRWERNIVVQFFLQSKCNLNFSAQNVAENPSTTILFALPLVLHYILFGIGIKDQQEWPNRQNPMSLKAKHRRCR